MLELVHALLAGQPKLEPVKKLPHVQKPSFLSFTISSSANKSRASLSSLCVFASPRIANLTFIDPLNELKTC